MSQCPQPYDVYQVKDFVLGRSSDPRPCIVLDVRENGDVDVIPLSGAMDLRRSAWLHFLISCEDPDFPATGLKKTCFAIGDCIATVSATQLLSKRGCLEGSLLQRFQGWI